MVSALSLSLCEYKYEEYLKYVNILRNGAILLGRYFTVDGFSNRPIRVITHAHSDHLCGLEESIKHSSRVIASSITLDLVEALGYVKQELAPLLRLKGQALNYHEAFVANEETCTLLKVDHIPGASQVLVKLKDRGISLGYTGDFKLTDKTEILENPNVLVIEATYSDPTFVRNYKSTVPQILADLVSEGLSKYKRVYIYAYHGKIQEAMSILRENDIGVPFVLPDKVYRATKLLECKYGYKYGEYFKERSPVKSDRLVFFKHFNTARFRRLDNNALYIVLTGRFTNEPFKKIDDYTYVISLSDHADFADLVEYVKLANPELVIIDSSRADNTEGLRSHLLSKGYCALSLP